MPAHRREPESTPTAESPIPRRLLFAGAAASLAGAGVLAGATPAEAAPTTDAWKLGGNSGVTTTGSNFLGPTNAGAPLIFKSKADSGASLTEKMRMTPAGRLGLGTTTPVGRLDSVSSSVAIRGTCTNGGTPGRGVVGTAPGGYGVEGTSKTNVGVYGGSGYTGVWGQGQTYGVVAQSDGYGTYSNGASVGVYGIGEIGSIGVGTTTGLSGSGQTGVRASSTDTSGTGMLATGGQYAVRGTDGSTAGVRGDSNYVGVWGQAASYGLYAAATATAGQNYGVYATTSSPDGFAVFAQGRMHVNGTLSKSAGSFQIDHPLDPDNKWLSHSFVESPDMMNVYNGNVVTDGTGNATVTLPDYFEALNRDFRYQLTVIGTFAQAIVSRKITGGSFGIATDKPNVEVSWQVTGIRQDTYAKEHPIVVETAKTGSAAGDRRSTSGSPFPGPDAGGDSVVPPAAVRIDPPQNKVPKGSAPTITKEP